MAHNVMQLFCLDDGHQVTQFGSQSALHQRILRGNAAFQIDLITLGAGGGLGYHQAVGNQLFLVLDGQGWVRGADEQRFKIRKGMAVFWRQGEWHESGTDTGLVAVVIEGSGFQLGMVEIPLDEYKL